jgi:selenocysteine-specific elongation factor
VPGHERFVKNMLAGATGIDLVLLVVAADEGVMPQTREHLAIVELLGVDRGVVALTKADLVDPDTLGAAREEIASLLAATPLRDAPVVAVSSVTGEGVQELLGAIDRAAGAARARDASGPVRLPVDRVFSLLGIGTVVTGTLWSGTVRVGDALEVLPRGAPVRVRQIQVHDESVAQAVAGQRTALALHGAAREEIARGDWVATPGAFRPTAILDVRLRLLAGAERALESRARIRIHLGASETLGRAVLFHDGSLPPGGNCRAQLRLEVPVVAMRGDRIVVRSYSPQVTIGGARVIDPFAPKRARRLAADERRLDALESGTAEAQIVALATDAKLAGLLEEDAALRLGLPAAEIRAARERAAGDLVRLRDGRLLSFGAWKEALARVEAEVRRYAETHPLREGVPKGELKSLLQDALGAPTFDAALEHLATSGGVLLRGDRVGLPEAVPALSPSQAADLERIERGLLAQGFAVPEASGLARGTADPAQGQELLRYLVDSGRAVKVTSELLYPRALWDEVEKRVRAHLGRHPALSMAEFKDLLQISRKYAVPVLEHLDRTGLTRRQGDIRVPGPRFRPPD